MRRVLFLLALFSIFFTSCSPSRRQFNELLSENKALKVKLAMLQEEIEKYEKSPDILYTQGAEYLKDKNRVGVAAICEELEKYHPTSPECAKLKSELAKLDNEIAKTEAAEKAKRMQAVNKLKKKEDDVEGITWYYNPYFTHYNNTNHASIYMGKRSSGTPWLRLRMSYAGNNWIFFEKAYLSYDGNTREIFFDKYDDKKTDNSGGGVWEWIDVGVDEPLLSYIREMVKGKSVKMRLSGKYTHTKDLTSTEINAIKDVLLGYDYLVNGE